MARIANGAGEVYSRQLASFFVPFIPALIPCADADGAVKDGSSRSDTFRAALACHARVYRILTMDAA